ncbi:hypothetical protein JOC70_002477 [Clostridium pascui]|nr:hypothetical protein [Clostridium pascui]
MLPANSLMSKEVIEVEVCLKVAVRDSYKIVKN